eukprot:4819742-Prymnesium_polylepis.1
MLNAHIRRVERERGAHRRHALARPRPSSQTLTRVRPPDRRCPDAARAVWASAASTAALAAALQLLPAPHHHRTECCAPSNHVR